MAIAEAVCTDHDLRAINPDAHMPAPLAARHETAYQWLQLVLPMVGTAAAFVHAWHFGIPAGMLAFTALTVMLTGLGITVGFHRLFTHRSFETVPAVRAALAILGSMAAQGSLYSWVASHRQHHRYSDDHGDPHSPNTGERTLRGRIDAWFHSHLGWMLTGHMTPERLRYIPDLIDDPLPSWVQRWHLLWIAVGLAAPAALFYALTGSWQAALSGLLWAGFVRILITDHISFAVNSVCHVWGERPFESRDLSSNNGVVAWLSFGEGWHNNHHAFPTSARHGLRPNQPDASYAVIRLLERCGLAWNIKTPTAAQIDAKLRPATVAER